MSPDPSSSPSPSPTLTDRHSHDHPSRVHEVHDHDQAVHDHDRGLAHDLGRLSRRRALTLFAGAVGLAACGSAAGGGDSSSATTAGSSTSSTNGSSSTTGSSSSASTTGSTVAASATGEIPEETAGPYPGDGSNGVNVLSAEGVVRQDIRSSFGSASGVAEGVPLTVELTVIDVAAGGGALPGAAVYLWHCDRDGNYSMYSDAVVDENYLRGVQKADGDGKLSFTTIFPGCYAGRWPHIHFEVYPDVDTALAAGSKLVTSQLAFPAEVCEQAYAADGYDASVRNLAGVSLDGDNIFSDGYSLQMATVTGDATAGYVARLNVGV